MADFPERTADDVQISSVNHRPASELTIGKIKVWVQTLNNLHRRQAGDAANQFAAIAVRDIRKGGAAYDAYYAEFAANDAEKNVEFLLEHDTYSGEFFDKAETKYPYPPEIERGNSDEPAYLAALDKYNDAVAKINKQRESHIESLRNEKRKQYRKITDATRNSKCMDVVLTAKFAVKYDERNTLEIILRAVRTSDDHSIRYFKSIEQIEDLDDEIRGAIIAKYKELDNIPPNEIPT